MPTKRLAKPFFVDADARRHMIAVEAYLLAEKRGFAAGGEAQDWIAAEQLVDARLTAAAVAERPKRAKATKKSADAVELTEPKQAKAAARPVAKPRTARAVKREAAPKPAAAKP